MVFLRFLSVVDRLEIKIVMLKWLCKTVMNHTQEWYKGLHLKVPHKPWFERNLWNMHHQTEQSHPHQNVRAIVTWVINLYVLREAHFSSCITAVSVMWQGRLLWNLIVYYIFCLANSSSAVHNIFYIPFQSHLLRIINLFKAKG